jgi:hypothetical protein
MGHFGQKTKKRILWLFKKSSWKTPSNNTR